MLTIREIKQFREQCERYATGYWYEGDRHCWEFEDGSMLICGVFYDWFKFLPARFTSLYEHYLAIIV